tara:strand:+ start:1202 stop:1492 length:291 start_codon:yes stop_codon:yes gene_type:complete
MSTEKTNEEVELERIYTIPFAKAWISPKYRRTVRVINMIKSFAQKHMKASEINLTPDLNEIIWQNGRGNPPRRITVRMVKNQDGVVTIYPQQESHN